MDILRSCFDQWVWWDDAQTVGSMVHWYFVDDDTPFFPAPHRFCSETWDEVHWLCTGAGFASDYPRTYSKGQSPVPTPTGKRFCGKLDWYLNGCPSDAPPLNRLPNGRPVCCMSLGAYSAANYSPAYDVLRD